MLPSLQYDLVRFKVQTVAAVAAMRRLTRHRLSIQCLREQLQPSHQLISLAEYRMRTVIPHQHCIRHVGIAGAD